MNAGNLTSERTTSVLNFWDVSLTPIIYSFKVEIEWQRAFMLPVLPLQHAKFVSIFILGVSQSLSVLSSYSEDVRVACVCLQAWV